MKHTVDCLGSRWLIQHYAACQYLRLNGGCDSLHEIAVSCSTWRLVADGMIRSQLGRSANWSSAHSGFASSLWHCGRPAGPTSVLDPGADEMTEAKKRARFLCVDCGADTLGNDYYTVWEPVWIAAGMANCDGMLCLACLSHRLGRRLYLDDFTMAPINKWPGTCEAIIRATRAGEPLPPAERQAQLDSRREYIRKHPSS